MSPVGGHRGGRGSGARGGSSRGSGGGSGRGGSGGRGRASSGERGAFGGAGHDRQSGGSSGRPNSGRAGGVGASSTSRGFASQAGASGGGRRSGRGGPRHASADPRAGSLGGPGRGIGGEQVEGRKAVRELLRANRRRVQEVWIAEDVDHADVITEIERLAARRHVAPQYVSRYAIERDARTDAPQGVLARAQAIPEVDLDDMATAKGPKGQPPFLLLLDGVTDPHNVGALIRSAEVAGATGIVLPRHRSAHVTPTVAKASQGAIEYLPMALVPGMGNALLRLRELGLWIIGLAGEGETELFRSTVDLTGPVALVLGAEGEGMGRLTRQRCDEVVAIPQLGCIDSLNVSAAGAVACFEVARRRQAAARGDRFLDEHHEPEVGVEPTT